MHLVIQVDLRGTFRIMAFWVQIFNYSLTPDYAVIIHQHFNIVGFVKGSAQHLTHVIPRTGFLTSASTWMTHYLPLRWNRKQTQKRPPIDPDKHLPFPSVHRPYNAVGVLMGSTSGLSACDTLS